MRVLITFMLKRCSLKNDPLKEKVWARCFSIWVFIGLRSIKKLCNGVAQKSYL